ncbi:MAG: hypothetical protein AAGH82_09090 [Pseudomonadota bacterium]
MFDPLTMAKALSAAGLIVAFCAGPTLAEENDIPLSPDERSAYISRADYAGAWPFKAHEGFFFCYRTGPFTFLTFHEYPDGPNGIDPPGLGFSLERDPTGLILETIVQGKYLRSGQKPEKLMAAMLQLRKEARQRCVPPYEAKTASDGGD